MIGMEILKIFLGNYAMLTTIIFSIAGFYASLFFLPYAISTHFEERITQIEESKHDQESHKY